MICWICRWAFGPATAGFLAGGGYFWLFVGDAATSVLFGLVAFCALPCGARASESQGKWPEALEVLRGDRKFQQLLLAAFAIQVLIAPR